jgi:tetratricopeptide (TPR) repeat protein
MQILLLLLKAEEQGVPWRKLAELVGGRREDSQKQHNNLRQQVRMLRNLIKNCPEFPEGKFIVGTREGVYYFSPDYEVETDTGRIDWRYQRLRDGISGEEKKRILQEICQLYTGEFLPALLGEEWATVEGAGYQSIYLSCVQELCRILEKEKAYSELIALCSRAGRLYPYGQWNEAQIKYLVKQNRYEEAVQVFEKTDQSLYEDFGIHPVKLSQAREGCLLPGGGRGRIFEILEEIENRDGRACPYWCSYPSFVDIYRILSRNIEESHSQATLLLCTMREKKGLEQEMERLQEQLERVMRSSDIYTRYSENQFIALLPETEAEGGQRVVERLRRSWMEEPEPSRAVVEFEISHV